MKVEEGSTMQMGQDTNQHDGGAVTSFYHKHPVLGTLVEEFVADLKAEVKVIDDAARGGDIHKVKSLSHRLKGTAGTYGFPLLAEHAGELETMTKSAEESGRKLSYSEMEGTLIAIDRVVDRMVKAFA